MQKLRLFSCRNVKCSGVRLPYSIRNLIVEGVKLLNPCDLKELVFTRIQKDFQVDFKNYQNLLTLDVKENDDCSVMQNFEYFKGKLVLSSRADKFHYLLSRLTDISQLEYRHNKHLPDFDFSQFY